MPVDQTADQPVPKRPARRARRLRRIPGLWVRLAAMALFVAALIVGMVGLTLKAVRPYREASAEAARLQTTRRQAAALEVRNEALRRHVAYLKTPDGVAEEAHRLGYMRPGEKPLVVLGLSLPDVPDDGAPAGPAPAGASPADTSLLGRFQSHLRDL